MKDLHISIESVRNSFVMVLEQLPEFLCTRLQYHDKPTEDPLSYWIRLGVGSDMLDTVVEADPYWDGTVLRVSRVVKDWENPIGQIEAIMLYLLRMAKFTDTRFAGSGPSNRGFMSGYSVGLDMLITMARDVPTNTDYHISGIERFTGPVRKHAAIASIIAVISESVIAELNEEQRVLIIIDDLEESIRDELAFVVATPSSTWQRLAEVCMVPGYGSAELAADAINSSYICFGYLEKYIFSRCREYPFCLARGDIEANIVALGSADHAPPGLDSGLGDKVRQLHRKGFRLNWLVMGVAMVRDIVFGIRAVEQGHGSLAIIAKMHPELNWFRLSIRCLLHQVRAMFQLQQVDAIIVKLRANSTA